jgi:hypothetical protein
MKKKPDDVWVKADDMARAILEIEEHYKKRERVAVLLINRAVRLATTACSENDRRAVEMVVKDLELYEKGGGPRKNKENTGEVRSFARKEFQKLNKEWTRTKRREKVNESLYKEYGFKRSDRWLIKFLKD